MRSRHPLWMWEMKILLLDTSSVCFLNYHLLLSRTTGLNDPAQPYGVRYFLLGSMARFPVCYLMGSIPTSFTRNWKPPETELPNSLIPAPTCCSGLGNVKTNHTQNQAFALISGWEAVILRAGQVLKTRDVFLPSPRSGRDRSQVTPAGRAQGWSTALWGCGSADKRALLTAHAEAEPLHVRGIGGRLRSARKVWRRRVCSSRIGVAVSLPSEAARKVTDRRVCFPRHCPRADAECLQPEYTTRARVSPPPLASGGHRAVTAGPALPPAYPSALTPCRPGAARLPEAARSSLSPTRRRQVWSRRPARPGAQTRRRRPLPSAVTRWGRAVSPCSARPAPDAPRHRRAAARHSYPPWRPR